MYKIYYLCYIVVLVVLLFLFSTRLEATPTYRFCQDMGAYTLCVDWNGGQVVFPKNSR